jgi:hypothetical protein
MGFVTFAKPAGAAAAVAMNGQSCMEQGVTVAFSFVKKTEKKVCA